MSKWTVYATCVVILMGMLSLGVVLVMDEGGEEQDPQPSACTPQTNHQTALKATRAFMRTYMAGNAKVFSGVGPVKEGDGFVLLVVTDRDEPPVEEPACISDTPVRYSRTGPFQPS